MQLTRSERIALLTVLERRIRQRLDDDKDEERQELLENFADTHCDRKALMVGDAKVGEVAVSFATAKPVIKPECQALALAELDEMGLAELVPAKGWEDGFALVGGDVVRKDTGEVCDWLMWQPSYAKTTVVRGIKEEKVRDAFGPRLEGVDAVALLGD